MIEVPALDGRVPLGFLATLGLHHLITTHHDPAATLAWEPTRCRPCLQADGLDDLDSLCDWLRDLATSGPSDTLMPGWPAAFPPPGAAPDRLRPARIALPTLIDAHVEAMSLIGALVTDLSHKDDGRVRNTPMVAPTGKQSFHTMLRNQHRAVRTEPDLLRQALTRWRRVTGAVAEAFDHGALVSAADDPAGLPGERAVPGATWLALAGLPRYRLAADERGRSTATAWRRTGNRTLMSWPLWRPALNHAAITVILEHPATTPRLDPDGMLVAPPNLEPLGITRLCAAERAGGNKSEGPLVPIAIRAAAG